MATDNKMHFHPNQKDDFHTLHLLRKKPVFTRFLYPETGENSHFYIKTENSRL